MAKAKNKKRISSDKVQSKNKNTTTIMKPKNPFEIHINNEKLKVLGRNNKHNKGFPGISRAKAMEKRKNTLLDEYKTQNKSNIFNDRRIGEHNKILGTEEKHMARFAAVRMKAHKKKSIFNLGEDEILTHKGQRLSEIEKFDDPRSEDEDFDDDNETGKLDEKFVEEAHFGGGVLQRTGLEGAKSHKDLIEQLIAESKKRKAEKQKTKEATLELTEKLDTEWKDLLPLVNKSRKKPEDQLGKSQLDDYDKVMRELKFEARGTVSDRLKSEEEIAKEEKDKLEKLEKERIERMKGLSEENRNDKYTHRSADDLDDDFLYEAEDEVILSYDNEGQSILPLHDFPEKNIVETDPQSDVEASNNESEDECESEDNLSDLKSGSSSDSEEEDVSENETLDGKVSAENNIDSTKQIRNDLLKRKEIMDKARDELPYTFSLPESYETLQSVLVGHSYLHQGVILERMIKCNHSSLSKGNKDNLGLLFAYILQYINDIASDADNENSVKNCFTTFDIVMPHIFDLAQMNQNNCCNSILEVIKEKFQEYWKKPKEYPGLENLLFLKMIDLLFPTSDFRHQVVTPSLIFIEQMLMKCRVRTKRDISYGLFLATLVLEYTTLSKRFMPGCINYLGGILHMAVPKSTVRLIKVIPPFKSISSDLVLINKHSTVNVQCFKMEMSDLVGEKMTESFKIRALCTALKILNEFYDNFDSLSSNIEIFETSYKYCKLIDASMYPEIVRTEMVKFMDRHEAMKTQRVLKYVVMAAKKPKALRLYEPKIVEVYDGKRHKIQSREKAERDKLLHKLKREKKGALREIRRDNAFLGRVKINEQIQSDKERKEKVKRIFAEASIQQSELNAMDRKRKKQ